MPSARHLRPRPVVSRCTVLILAGFLIGFSLSGAIEDGLLRTQIFICGIVGMISFIGLDFVVPPRQVIADLLRDEEAEQMRQVAESLTNVRESLRARAGTGQAARRQTPRDRRQGRCGGSRPRASMLPRVRCQRLGEW